MEDEGLSGICAGLGSAEEDEDGAIIGYTTGENCLDNLKDLQRYLRRDDPQRRNVFKQICKWNVVSHDLIPIIEYYQNDHNLMISAVKILVFLTMPVDPSSDDVAQQIECLWDLKAAMARNVMIAVIVSLLEDPLDHLERDSFTEDDWKLVQLVVTLFRNILAIQDITLQQKASGSATQFLCLTDSILELLFQENIMDIILVLTQHVGESSGYLQQDNLLLLEIFHNIFLRRDPELIAKVYNKKSETDGDINASLDSLKSIMEEEREKKRIIKQRSLERHSMFSGTFTRLSMDGSKMLFKGNPASASGNSFLKVHKVQRGPLKRIAWDHGSLLLPKKNISELLHNFLNQFLSGGYNGRVMQSILRDIEKEDPSIQHSDIITFFQVAAFVFSFQYQRALVCKKPDMKGSTSESSLNYEDVDHSSFSGDLCGSVAATMNGAMFNLVINKWREAFESLKETSDYKTLSAAGSLMKKMIRLIDLVLKIFPEDSKEPQTARILLYKLFYDQTDQGLTHFLFNQFKSFDSHKQPKSDLADLLEIIHVVFRLMEKLQACGLLRVSKKTRRGRKKKAPNENVHKEAANVHKEAAKPREADASTTEVNSQLDESGMPTCQPFVDSGELGQEQVEPNLPEAADIEGKLFSNPLDSEEVNTNFIDIADGTSDYSTDDQVPATSEVDFNVSRLVLSFANNAVINNLGWLLRYYKSNSVGTNHHLISMLRRFCEDLEMTPMLYQLSLLTIIYDILADKKSTRCKEYANITSFLTKFVRKMLKLMTKQPLFFVEILFWKTRKECHCMNADALMCDIANFKKDIRNLGNNGTGLSNNREQVQKSIADSLGDDEADLAVPYYPHHQTNTISPNFETTMAPRRKRAPALNQEQENTIRNLYEKYVTDTNFPGHFRYKDERKCAHLIAEALDSDGKVSSAQVSRKLKQLGLRTGIRKTPEDGGASSSARDDPNIVRLNALERDASHSMSDHGKGSILDSSIHRRKRTRAFSKDQELQIKELFARYKNDENCSRMIAKALDADNTYTASQVSHKLKQLGLLVLGKKVSPIDVELTEDKRTIDSDAQSDEETLLGMLPKRQRKTMFLADAATIVPQDVEASKDHNSDVEMLRTDKKASEDYDSDRETLSTILGQRKKRISPVDIMARTSKLESDTKIPSATFEDVMGQHESESNLESRREVVSTDALEDDIASEVDYTDDRGQETGNELMELEDSGDDTNSAAPQNVMHRRNLRLVIDEDEDE
uniref:Timeless N-terminal domain-containing protein n=1 Tax=Ananas comosus var. bracteatus TaxID=296719 RepID=A0A6V7NZT2_ANACO|nr:unnamed protein product [Ananas comosus var. bracteatus]